MTPMPIPAEAAPTRRPMGPRMTAPKVAAAPTPKAALTFGLFIISSTPSSSSSPSVIFLNSTRFPFFARPRCRGEIVFDNVVGYRKAVVPSSSSSSRWRSYRPRWEPAADDATEGGPRSRRRSSSYDLHLPRSTLFFCVPSAPSFPPLVGTGPDDDDVISSGRSHIEFERRRRVLVGASAARSATSCGFSRGAPEEVAFSSLACMSARGGWWSSSWALSRSPMLLMLLMLLLLLLLLLCLSRLNSYVYHNFVSVPLSLHFLLLHFSSFYFTPKNSTCFNNHLNTPQLTLIPPRLLRRIVQILIFPQLWIPNHTGFCLRFFLDIVEETFPFVFFRESTSQSLRLGGFAGVFVSFSFA
mmetsp:Transcript_17288/g.34742  ORF Transcript_17288/g.34742 Transcript_17288/m.34742 type:complete len:356 (-) Transcript_17288:750-1817(-)